MIRSCFLGCLVVSGTLLNDHATFGDSFQTTGSPSETIRFVVSEVDPIHRDSFILPLSNPSDIAHGRDLIKFGPSIGGAIAVAQITAGSDGVNRNVLEPQAPAWSWHVTEFTGFVDNTIEILDGWPTFVESDVEGWIDDTGGAIGFWSYSVTAELPAGDYDFDFDVDMHDYATWRSAFGSSDDLAADGSGNGIVDAADYTVWRDNLGASNTAPSQIGPVIPVPEPSAFTVWFLSLFFLFLIGRQNPKGPK